MSKRKRSDAQAGDLGAAGHINPADVLPGITRKITACAACRKQKIKCDMPNEGPPCVRCTRRGLSCVLNKSLQALVEDAKQTELVQSDVRNLFETLDIVCQHLNLTRPKPLISESEIKASQSNKNGVSSDTDREQDNACEISPPESPSAVHAPIDSFLDIAKLGSPGSADTPQSLRKKQSIHQEDIIGKGIISIAIAESLVHRYFSKLDHYLYGICSEFSDWMQLRQTSPILLAAICTVSAFHDPNDQSIYEACNREFRRLVTRSTFEKTDVNHIRALCISSFWLADASRIISSDAIRRAADMRLQRSFNRVFDASVGDTFSSNTSVSLADNTDRVRLWYLLFVCDQHLSILHNRDSLLRSDREITVNWETYLQRDGVTDSEIRILSQVSLLLIMGEVRDVLGSELETQLPKALANQLNNYSRQLDKWFTKFSALFKPNAYVGEFPRRGLQMHYHFGKLYLGHSVFKGLEDEPIPSYFLTAANMAHDAAVAIFEMILNEGELQESLVGMPHYFHIMIAFAGQFLLEVCKKYHEQLSIDLESNFNLISRVLAQFQNTPCIPQHPIRRMTPGLSWKLYDCAGSLQRKPTGEPMDDTSIQISSDIMDRIGSAQPQVHPHMSEQFSSGSYLSAQGLAPMGDVFYADFGEFQFPEMWSNFVK